MANRTSYYNLQFRRGEIKHIEEAAGEDDGVTQDDLDREEVKAMNRVNGFILKVAGQTKAAEFIAEFLDDSNVIDPLIVQMAEQIAAAGVMEEWERYNYAAETREGQGQRKDAGQIRGKATQIAQDIVDSGGTMTAAGTFRRWAFAPNQQGPRVTGPLVKGSYFDPLGYTDAWGRQGNGPSDPYWR